MIPNVGHPYHPTDPYRINDMCYIHISQQKLITIILRMILVAIVIITTNILTSRKDHISIVYQIQIQYIDIEW